MQITDKLKDIHQDISHNITRIYGRDDLLTAFDLVYHSVLSFYFQGRLIRKGWVEGIIVGDTRCGKTETSERLIDYYRLGEISSGENTSFAGIVGGLQQTQKRWNIIWGKLPLNDKKLLIIDEVSGLRYEDIANMSSIRSSGIAEITKVQTERTFARTRLLWLSNPRIDQPVNYFNSGIDIVRNLIGKPEDIARFDFALLMSADEVPIDTINNSYKKKVFHKYKAAFARNLVLWAWSRKPEEIIIDEETTDEILFASKTLCEKYSEDFPIITATEQKIKVAKLATSLACRLFSTEDGVHVNVRPEHVSFIYYWLDEIYSKPCFAYDIWSKTRKDASRLGDEDEVIDELTKYDDSFVYTLLELKQIRVTDIEESLGIERSEAKMIVSFLMRQRAIKKTHNFYIKTPAFIGLLRRLQSQGLPKRVRA